MKTDTKTQKLRVIPRIADIAADDWDACIPGDEEGAFGRNPFVSHGFLRALEDSGSVRAERGWQPQHLILEAADGRVLGCMPCYLKSHSRGEYVFDDSWADAYGRAGGRYYPKLQCAAPFTPVTGPRLLVPVCDDHDAREQLLIAGGVELARRLGSSSLHITFPTPGEWQRLGALGFLLRTDQQFHWLNRGYVTFDDFLATLASRKRKSIRKERRDALGDGIEIEWLEGAAITEAHWDVFFAFYMDTGSRKWGTPYLNRAAFSLLGAAMPERIVLILCKRNRTPIAGALNFIGDGTLFGRYWGCVEHHPALHFEACYYQAIEFAIARGLSRVEAGAQGAHKLARGYLPAPTYSAHYIADPGLRRAVAEYLQRERRYVDAAIAALTEESPYRHAG